MEREFIYIIAVLDPNEKMKTLRIFIMFSVILPVSSYAVPMDDRSPVEKEMTLMSVKQAGVTITTEQGEKKEWRYPYFVGSASARLKQLNSWLRETSIRRLFPEDDGIAEKALKSKDSQVIAMLKTDKAIQDVAAEAATVSPDQRFGTLIFLTAQSVYHGVHYFINVDRAIYDYAEGEEVNMESLFVQGAEQELTDLLAQSIRKSLQKAKQESNACLVEEKKNPGYHCPELSIDVQQCISGILLHWNWLDIKDNRNLRYQVPYMPNTTAACGYEDSFEVHGLSVEKLLREPARFKKAVHFSVPANAEPQAKK